MQVQCPCGETFDRQPQRGRPAIWCPKCRTLPVAQRVERVTEEGEPVEHKVSRFGPYDVLTYEQRETVEDGIATTNVKFREEIWPNRAKLFGGTTLQQTAAAHEWHHRAMIEVYHAVDPKRWPKGIGSGEETS
jgi:hypothetical protein